MQRMQGDTAETLYELMSTQRAVRRLRPDPIPVEVVDRVLQAACWAPTGGNGQQWRILVLRDPAKKQALGELYGPMWHPYAEKYAERIATMPPERQEPSRRTLEAGTYLADHFGELPVVLVFLADMGKMTITDSGLDRTSIIGGGSIYPAVQNALLAARAEGLGCVLTTLHAAREAEVQEVLGVPEHLAIAAVVPLGWPVGAGHGPITRRPPSQMAWDDEVGVAWGEADEGADT